MERQLPALLSRSTTFCHGSRTLVVAARGLPLVGLRTMATGPHPDPAIRASYVDYAGHIIEEALLTVGEVLGRFYPVGWFSEHVKPLIDGLHALRRSSPIDPVLVARL